MPTNYVQEIADKTQIPIKELEGIWNKAITEAENKKIKNKYAYATAALHHVAKSKGMDAESQRYIDANGALICPNSVITGSDVANYFGGEIPNWQRLGLNEKQIYRVYRPVEEMIDNDFSGKHVLERHIGDFEASTFAQYKSDIVGVAYDCVQDGTQIKGTVAFNDPSAIDALEDGKKYLSAGYWYDPVLEKGVFNGMAYDIKMTNIKANHIAHVENPRYKKAIVGDNDNVNSGVNKLKFKDKYPSLYRQFTKMGLDEDLAEKAISAMDEKEQEEADKKAADACAKDEEDKKKAEDEKLELEEKAKKAELRIRDQLIETNFHAECRKIIEDAGKLGTGILKGPIPRRVQTLTKTPEGVTQITYKIAPASERVSPFNFFPDPNCGNNISDGSYVFERDYMTARQLKELRDSPGYLAEEIDNILEQGPGKVCLTQESLAVGRKTLDDDRYEIWYYTGDIKISELAMYDQNVEFKEESEDYFVSATFVLVNDTIIKANVNPFTLAGDLPYDVFPWQRVEGSCWGVGVARHGRVPQKMLLAGARALMDNMALSVAPIIGINRAALIPANNSWALRGGKLFYTREGSDVKAVSDAITAVSIPSHQEEITGIIQLVLKMMEDSTGVTFLLQGQQGAAPDTVGGMQLVHQNATAFLRRVARLYDEHITEPHIRRYYANLLKTGEEEEIGDARIEAVGSSALVEREVQLLQLQQMLQMTADPEFQISKKKLAAEMLRLWKYDPSKFMMDSKELEALQSQTPPPDPTIEAARIRTEGEVQVAQIKTEAQLEKVRKDTDRDLLYAQGVEQRNEMTHELRISELQLKRELAILEYANKYNMQLEDIKAKLASDSMKLQVQKELSAINKEMPQVISPPSEPKGRADEGKSFSE